VPSLYSEHFQTDLRAGVGRLRSLVWDFPPSFFQSPFLLFGTRTGGRGRELHLTANSCWVYSERDWLATVVPLTEKCWNNWSLLCSLGRALSRASGGEPGQEGKRTLEGDKGVGLPAQTH
jgi:hypothetical protein